MIKRQRPLESLRSRRLKRGLTYRLWRTDEGAVSLYLIVSTAAMLLFTALLVDYARIAAFNKQSELAAQSGIRSALSAYDEKLYERYGLFGAGGSDRNMLFAQTVESNWEADDTSGFGLLRIRREASHVDTYEVLGNQTVFTRQILEEMKYKAPIDFTMEIASRFVSVGSAMKEASHTLHTLEEIKQLYEEREKHLKRILVLQQRSADRASQLEAKLAAASEIVSGYAAFESWRQEDALRGKGKKPLHKEAIASYTARSQQDAAALSKASAEELLRQAADMEEAKSELQAAEQSNAAIAEAAASMSESQESNGFDRLSEADIGGREGSSMTPDELSQYGDSRASAEGLVMEASWFAGYRQELNDQYGDYERLDAAASAFQASVQAALSATGGALALNQAWEHVNAAYHAYVQRYANPGTIIHGREDELRRRHAHDGERKSNEAAATSKWSQVKAMMGGMSSESGQQEQREAFQEVKRYAADNLLFNALSQEDGSQEGESRQAGGADDEAKSAMTSMESVFGGMAGLLDGVRDPLYVNEYVVHRFRSFDPSKLKGMLPDGKRDEFAQALALENQEVEYILYGLHEPGANVAAAFGEIFAARLAIRTMEGFIACRALGNPLLVLSAAVLYGLEKAIADLAILAEKGKVELSKYVPVELTYADYLRLFLILHGSGGQARKARMIAVIERNTDTDLSSVATGLSGELTCSVNLWFLPGLMRTFTAAGLLNGKVKGGRYEKTQTIGTSYG